MLKKLFYISLGIIITLFLLVISLPVIFKDKLKAELLEKIDQGIDAKVSFSNLSFSSFKHFPHFTLSLHNTCVKGIQDFEGDTLLSAKEISISFDLYSLIRRHAIEINSVQLDEPILHARILANGKANYDIVKQDTSANQKTSGTKFQININKWSIKNGSISYDNKLQKTYIEVGGLYHNGSGDFKQNISDLDITTRISELTFTYNGIQYLNKKLFKADLLMEMNFKEKKFIFKDHSFQLADFKFGFDGYFKLLDSGYQTDLSFVVKKSSFKDLLSLLPGIYDKDIKDIQTKGDFSCTGFIKGTYDIRAHKVPSFHINLEVENAEFKYAHLPKAIENIHFHLLADNPDGIANHATFDLKDFHFEIDKKAIQGALLVKRQHNTYVKADIHLTADLAEIENIYPVNGLVIKGLLNSEIKIDGEYNDSLRLFPKVDAFLVLENAFIKSKNSPLEMDSIHMKAEVTNSTGQMADTKIGIRTITFLLDHEPFKMSGTISDLKDYNYDLKISGLLDLGKLTQVYPVSNTTLKGTLDIDYTAQGSLAEIESKQYDLLKTEGTLEAKNIVYQRTDMTHPLHVDDALLTFTPDKIVLNRFIAEFGYSNITLSGHLFNYMPYLLRRDAPINGDLSLSCDTIDFNQWFPKSIPSGSAPAVKSQMEVLVIPKNIGFTVNSVIKTVKFNKMDITDLSGSITLHDGILTLNETNFGAMDSKFSLRGDYNTTDIKHPLFDLTIGVQDLDINKAYQMFIDDKANAPAQGNFSTDYNLKGELTPDFSPIYATLTGNGKIIIDRVSIKGMKLFNHIKTVSRKEEFNNPELNDITMDTEIKGGKIFIHPFRFNVNKFLTEVEGSQGFDDKIDYLIKLSAPPFNKLKIPISIMGTSDKPIIKLGNDFSKSDFEKL